MFAGQPHFFAAQLVTIGQRMAVTMTAVAIPAVEVHLSDVSSRESFRQISYPGMACLKTFMGLGFEGYRQAIFWLKNYLEKE